MTTIWYRTVLTVLLMSMAGKVTAQPRTLPIGDQPSCPRCTATLHSVITLGSSSDPAGFFPLMQVARNSRGEYAVSSTTFVGEIFIYGSDGKFLRSFGRKGSGPGEFNRAQLLAFDVSDSLHALSIGGGRYSVLSPSLTAVHRSAVVPSRTMSLRVEADNSLFVVAPTASGGSSHALQILTESGRARLTFDELAPSASGQVGLGKVIALDARGNRWSAAHSGYSLRQWDRSGTLVKKLEADRDWIVDVLPNRLDPSRQRPPAQISGIETDERGLLWVFVTVPDPNWAPSPAGTRPDINEVYDTHLEVIDLATGKLLAVGHSSQMVQPFQKGLAYSVVEDLSGDLRLNIWKMEVSTK